MEGLVPLIWFGDGRALDVSAFSLSHVHCFWTVIAVYEGTGIGSYIDRDGHE